MPKTTKMSKICVAFSRVRSLKKEKEEKKKEKNDTKQLNNEYYHKDCAICMDPLKSKQHTQLVVQCNHSFHETCLMQWGRACAERTARFSCPVCRKSIEQIVDHSSRKCFPFDFKRQTILPENNTLLTGRVIDLGDDQEEIALETIDSDEADDMLTVFEFFMGKRKTKTAGTKNAQQI